MGQYSGSVVYGDAAYRQSCQRLAERGLVERVDRSRWRLTSEGAEYVKSAVEATCRRMSIRFDGIVWVRPTPPQAPEVER
jgi:repressor of nif and glnA expression